MFGIGEDKPQDAIGEILEQSNETPQAAEGADSPDAAEGQDETPEAPQEQPEQAPLEDEGETQLKHPKTGDIVTVKNSKVAMCEAQGFQKV